jgi:hypothetical protein
MLEIALLLVASVVALACAAVASRRARDAAGPAETVRSTRHVRDDAVVAAAASVVMFVLAAIGHRAGALVAGAWAGGACATGALASMIARTWRERAISRAAGAAAEQVVIVFALGALAAIAAAAAHAISDPQRLAVQIPEMIAAFAVGCAALDMGERALPSVAAMVLASYFFDSNAGMLRSGPSYASALGIVLLPLAATTLGAMGSATAVVVWPDSQPLERDTARSGAAIARRAQAASVLALPAAVGAALALAGWLWAPLSICAALGVVMTLAPRLVGQKSGRGSEAAALVGLAACAIGSYAVARHTGLAHAGPFGLAIAAVAAESAALVDRSDSHESLADRQASALVAIALTLAVLDGATLFRCTRFADLAHAPTDDTAALLAHCTLANIAPARVDVSHPVTLVAALAALAACVVLKPETSLRGRAITVASVALGVVAIAAVAHFGFGLGIEAAAAATLACSFASALFPSVCSRNVSALVAASALALGAAL